MIAEALARQPASGAVNGEEFLYWSKERLGGKALINATHVRIFRPTGIKAVEVLMTGTQIFATHYLDAFLGVTALVRDRRTPRGYFVYPQSLGCRSTRGLLGSPCAPDYRWTSGGRWSGGSPRGCKTPGEWRSCAVGQRGNRCSTLRASRRNVVDRSICRDCGR